MQEAQVQTLVWEDPTCYGATKPMDHNYWSLHTQERVRHERSHCSEKPKDHNKEQPLHVATKTQPSHKKNK